MRYRSTRGGDVGAGFEDVLLAGLARDGGLYMPEVWPRLPDEVIAGFRGARYADVAAAVMAPYTEDAFSQARLREMAAEAYVAFGHPEVAPLKQVGDEDWILELFHGPTLAFKDFAMQMLGRLFDDALARRGETLTIIAATSGDTGAAAIEALRGRAQIRIVVLHPEGRVSEVQRRMMTSVSDENVTNIAVDGSFDDCQAIVKALFADPDFVARVGLSGVNSINWARLAAQIVYYFTAAAALPAGALISFVVPTGNFGDIFAGYAAKQMGAPVARLGVATNANDILHRAVQSGDYSSGAVAPTSSPSMDIQVASNFERLLFEVMKRDCDKLCERMESFRQTGALKLDDAERAAIAADFVSCAVNEAETLAEIGRHYAACGDLIDPHTAVGRAAVRALRDSSALTGAVVTLATAHPAKFPDAVEKAAGLRPALPEAHAGLFDRPERFVNAPAQAAAVRAIILDRQ
ncbi:MAG: threonine synthase [Hyphococcus sp.]